MSTILPTGHCFDDALDYITERVPELDDAGRAALRLVHAICIAQDGTPYAHAWVEDDGKAWDAGLLDGKRIWYAVEIAEFMTARHVMDVTRYTLTQALEANWSSGHYGPWKPAYKALCGQSGKIMGIFEVIHEP
jgi:hypothetical protein